MDTDSTAISVDQDHPNGRIVQGDDVRGDKISGDKITAGDIEATNVAIGQGAQIIVNQVHQTLSAIDEMEKGIESADRQLALAISEKMARYSQLAQLSKLTNEKNQRNPYKSLLDYKLEDAPYFFGREEAIHHLLGKIQQDRLTILHSDSGSGKTSLLQAGLSAHLLADGHFPLYLRPYKAPPGRAIKRAFLSDYAKRPELTRFRDDQMSLKGFLEQVTRYLGGQRLYIFLDQFEEFFTELNPEAQHTFATQLQDCIESELPIWWVLALRKEYFSDLRIFHAMKPFDNQYFLPTFNLVEAREVITEPARLKGVTYSANLINQILDDVSDSSSMLMPVHLQLVCSTLFAERETQSNPQLITPRLYYKERGSGDRKAPGAKGILRTHLSRTLQQQMSPAERQLAWRVLYTLVTSQKRRAQRSRSAIRDELQATGNKVPLNEAQLNKVLHSLENSRLVRVDENEKDELLYELAHEYLLDEFELDPQTQAIKLAQEILDQETFYYRHRGVLLAKDKYDIVSSQREHLQLDQISRELLDKSEEQQTRELREVQERERKTRRRLQMAIIFALLAIASAIVAINFSNQATIARTEAENFSRILLAQRAVAEESTNPSLALLLAIESYKLNPRSAAHNILRNAIDQQIHPVATVHQSGPTNPTAGLPAFNPIVSSPCWSSDGRYIIAGSLDAMTETVQIWDSEAITFGEPLATFENVYDQELSYQRLMPIIKNAECYYDLADFGTNERPDWWVDVQFIEKSPAASLLVIHYLDGSRTIIDIDNLGNPILPIDQGVQLEWSQDGSAAMTWSRSDDGEYQTSVWSMENINNSNPLLEITSLKQPVLSSDGTQIAALVEENRIGVWDIQSGTKNQITPGAVDSLSWVPNQKMLLVRVRRDDEFASAIWDISAETVLSRTLKLPSFGDVEWSPDGEYYLAENVLGSISVWPTNGLDNSEPVATIPSQPMNTPRWNRDGTQFITWNEDGSVQIWDTQNVQATSGVDDTPQAISLGLFPVTTQSRSPVGIADFEPRWAKNGYHVQIPHRDGSTTVWGTQEGHFMTIYRENVQFSEQVESPYFMSVDSSGLIELWDIEEAKSPYLQPDITQWPVWGNVPPSSHHDPYCEYEPESGSKWLCLWSADRSKYLVINTVGDADEFDAFIVDAVSGEILLQLPEIIDPIDGGWQANDSVIWLRAQTGQTTYILDSNSGEILFESPSDGTIFAISDDLSQLITRNSFGEFQLYANRNFQNPIWTGTGAIEWISFVQDGTHFVTMDEAGAVTVWQTGNQIPLMTIDNVLTWSGWYEDPPPIELKPDGSAIAVMKNDGHIYVYPTDPTKWIEVACAIAQRNLSWEEWQISFPNETYYQRTCPKLPIHPSVLDQILQENSPDTLTDYFAAWKSFDEATATTAEQAIGAELDTFVSAFIRQQQIATAVSLINYGSTLPTPSSFSENTLFELCLVGSLLDRAEDVIFACDEAVARQPAYGPYHGARGIALLNMENENQQAQEEIQFFLNWSAMEFEESETFGLGTPLADLIFDIDDSWLVMLENGENPMNREVRSEMRDLMRFILDMESDIE